MAGLFLSVNRESSRITLDYVEERQFSNLASFFRFLIPDYYSYPCLLLKRYHLFSRGIIRDKREVFRPEASLTDRSGSVGPRLVSDVDQTVSLERNLKLRALF